MYKSHNIDEKIITARLYNKKNFFFFFEKKTKTDLPRQTE